MYKLCSMLDVNPEVPMKILPESTLEDIGYVNCYNLDNGGVCAMLTGVYVLYNDNEVVYVGKSNKCIRTRLKDHRKSTKVFNRIRVYADVSEVNTHVLEVLLITQYKPMYNRDCKAEGELTIQIQLPEDVADEVFEFEYWSEAAISEKREAKEDK